MSALVEGDIRPTRISVLVCPGGTGPVLGRAAIHRYGEEIVGDHELRAWQPGENGAPDALYATADLATRSRPNGCREFKCEFYVARSRPQRANRISKAALRVTRGAWRVTRNVGATPATRHSSPVKRVGATVTINREHKACVSIHDYLGRTDRLRGAAFWSISAPRPSAGRRTRRGTVGRPLRGGRAQTSDWGQDHIVKGDESLGAVCSNKASGPGQGGATRRAPDPERLMRASERLRDLIGENVLPLEDEVSVAAKSIFLRSSRVMERRGWASDLGLKGGDRADDTFATLRRSRARGWFRTRSSGLEGQRALQRNSLKMGEESIGRIC